jgi:pyridoxine 4-dehydrogenase
VLPTAGGLLAELDAVAASSRLTRSQAALAWCVAKGTVPLVGARKRSHVASAADAASARLSPGAVAALDAAAAKVARPTLQNVFATG